jgi:anthranilate synthase component 1
VIPVVRRFLVDDQTPVGCSASSPGPARDVPAGVGGERPHLEPVLVHRRAQRGDAHRADGQVAGWGTRRWACPRHGLAVDALRDTLESLRTPRPAGLPPLTGGLVGFIGYDAVRRWERLPDDNPDDLHLPELAMLLVTDLAVMDHVDGSVWLVANA